MLAASNIETSGKRFSLVTSKREKGDDVASQAQGGSFILYC